MSRSWPLKVYKDFILKFQYFFPVGGIMTRAGSGIIIMPDSGDGLSYQRVIECQVRPGESGDFWTFRGASLAGEQRHGALGKVARKLDAELPPGHWNEVVIRCEGSRITYELNGRVVNRADSPEPISGWIGLMNQGSAVHFREIAVAELSPSAASKQTQGPVRKTAAKTKAKKPGVRRANPRRP